MKTLAQILLKQNLVVINNLKTAIEMCCDGGPSVFTENQEKEMYNFLNKIEREIK